jgi:hypothetical protein
MKWTKEYCQQIALTCKTRKELSEKSRTCYTISHKKGWLEEICSHMPKLLRESANHWTKENCQKEALKYNTRSLFEKGNLGAYTKARRQNWLDEICQHMDFRQRGAQGKKKVYILVWTKENMVYIGITNNPKRRINDHLENSSNQKVRKLISEGNNPIVEIVSDWLSFEDIVQTEQNLIEKYKAKGWVVLNIAKGGALGGITVKWNYDMCKQQALKYTSRGAFEENESGCYKAAIRLGIYEEICNHMDYIKLPNNALTKEKCSEIAQLYRSRTEFSNSNGGAYNKCLKNGWLDKVCQHMDERKKKHGYWNKENCKIEASKYTTRGEFNKHSASCYGIAIKNGWLNEICAHMTSGLGVANFKWTKDKCIEEGLKYSTRSEMQKGSSGAYKSAVKHGWIDKVCAHMPLHRNSIKKNGL